MEVCPETLPVFPLTGALLLPGGRLPLHIFEPRYRNMVEDVVKGEGFIGMIQPFSMQSVNYAEGGDPNEENDHPDLYHVGCAGLLERWERLPDGRYLILLKGISRFRWTRELELQRGYRQVEAVYEGFSVDLQEMESDMTADRLVEALRTFSESHQVELEWDKIGELSGQSLLNSVAMTLPFPPAEKQALLEAPNINERLELLLALMDMGVLLRPDEHSPMPN